ncbi:MAG: RNA polymerase factor sigma-54 [Thermodesulfobacteriota bacterium]
MSKLNLTTAPKLVQQQRLILTQELQLFLKLIQMNTLELKDYLEEQLVENPTLEESEETEKDKDSDEGDDELEDIDLSGFENLTGSYNDDLPHSPDFIVDIEDENPWENRVSKAESLFEYLNWQLEVSEFTSDERDIANLIIGNINEDGYLEANIEELILNHFTNESFRNNSNGSIKNSEHINKENILLVLNKIQKTFDPIGVGSRSLEECLKIQLRDMGYTDDSAIINIIENHLEDLSNDEFEKVSETLSLDMEEVKELYEIISNLEPKPGRPFYTKDTEKYVVPDFFLYKVGNEYQLQCNKNFPRVRISNYYRNLIKNQGNLTSETKKYVREKLEAAKRILKCLEEREAAVRKVVERITEVQKDYFEHGEEYLKPLRLKDVAEIVGVHESTVSRITSNRYMQTPRGVIELKSLFSRGVDTSTGKQVSLERVKSIIKEIVSNEYPENPFSDEDISKILKHRNIKVARRTVAKYRMILKIPSSSKRMLRA